MSITASGELAARAEASSAASARSSEAGAGGEPRETSRTLPGARPGASERQAERRSAGEADAGTLAEAEEGPWEMKSIAREGRAPGWHH
jgi:hypothetical protein